MHFYRALITAIATTGILVPACPAYAQNAPGRYEMVTLPTGPGSFDSRIMILDTVDGHLWQWWEAPAVGSSAPSSGITYMGKVGPGSSSSEITSPHRSGPPEPLLPKR